MTLKTLKIHNILSVQDATIEFPETGLILVDGWSHDSNRANGAGKTSIFNALAFALYGKVPRDIPVSEILKRGAKTGYAEATVRAGDDLVAVKRERPNKVTYFINSKQVNITQDEFESKIKLSYEQFMITAYSAQGTSKRFLLLNDTGKKDFLLELMNLSEFSDCKKAADSKIGALEKEVKGLEINIASLASRISAYRESSVDEDSHNDKISELQKLISDNETKISNYSLVAAPDLSKFIKLEESLNLKLRALSETKAKREMAFAEFRKLQSQNKPYVSRQHDANCPHCQSQLIVTGRKVALHSDDTEIRRQHEEFLAELTEKSSAINEAIKAQDAELSKESEILDLQAKMRQKKVAESKDYDMAQKQIAMLHAQNNSYNAKIQGLNSDIVRAKELEEKIQAAGASISEASVSMQAKSQLIDVYSQVSHLFSATGAPAYIMDTMIDAFNQLVGEYISVIWDNASYSLQSHKDNKDGSVKAKFSEKLVIDGKEVSLGSLSGGEFKALSLATDLTLIDVLSNFFAIHISPIALDEPFDGLDSAGRELIIGLLERVAETRLVCVIDHASEAKALFSHTIMVEKRNGTSSVSML